MNAIPAILSSVNRETKYALNYFGVKEPIFLNDVKLKVKDLDYSKGYMVYEDCSVYDAYQKMVKEGISKIPIVDKAKKILGIISMKDIAEACLNGDYSKIDTDYKNILSAINGTKITKYDNVIKGRLIVPGYSSTTFISEIKLTENDILITGDRYSILEYAINSKVKLIVVTNGMEIKPELLKIARVNKVNIISTNYTTLDTINKFNFCNNVSSIINTTQIHTVNENDDLSSFITVAEKTRYTYYPIVDNNKKCLGIIKYADVGYHNKKKVILVDHNEKSQAVDGIDEAEILEIIDHHKLGSLETITPIVFRNYPLGCTSTIIYKLYKSYNVPVGREMAGLMCSAILSDTLMFRSPTCTDLDKQMATELAAIADIDIEQYALSMFEAGSDFGEKSIEEIFYTDFKTFNSGDIKFGVSQVSAVTDNLLSQVKSEIAPAMKKAMQEKRLDLVFVMLTNIMDQRTRLIHIGDINMDYVKDSFPDSTLDGDVLVLNDVVSRKKQLIPGLMEAFIMQENN